MSSAICFYLDQDKILSSGKGAKSHFIAVSFQSPLRFVAKMFISSVIIDKVKFDDIGKMIYPFEELSAIFIEVKIVVCKIFQFGRI